MCVLARAEASALQGLGFLGSAKAQVGRWNVMRDTLPDSWETAFSFFGPARYGGPWVVIGYRVSFSGSSWIMRTGVTLALPGDGLTGRALLIPAYFQALKQLQLKSGSEGQGAKDQNVSHSRCGV